jgi:hypothetical protein
MGKGASLGGSRRLLLIFDYRMRVPYFRASERAEACRASNHEPEIHVADTELHSRRARNRVTVVGGTRGSLQRVAWLHLDARGNPRLRLSPRTRI